MSNEVIHVGIGPNGLVSKTKKQYKSKDGLYSTNQVAKMAHTSYRQLDSWCRVGLIEGQPAGSSTGSGGRRRWTNEQVRRARLLRIASIIHNSSFAEILGLLEHLGVLERLEQEFGELGTGEGDEGNQTI